MILLPVPVILLSFEQFTSRILRPLASFGRLGLRIGQVTRLLAQLADQKKLQQLAAEEHAGAVAESDIKRPVAIGCDCDGVWERSQMLLNFRIRCQFRRLTSNVEDGRKKDEGWLIMVDQGEALACDAENLVACGAQNLVACDADVPIPHTNPPHP